MNLRDMFLLDGLGALLSCFLLGVVLVRFENVFGIPQSTLYILAFWPLLFALFDLFCFYFRNDKPKFLRIIAIANLCYCILSLALVFSHSAAVTTLGWIYIIVEIIVVIILAKIELVVARQKS